MTTRKPLWLLLAPFAFVVLWAAGYSVAKVGMQYAEPLTLLAWRYFFVLVLLLPLYFILKPNLPKRLVNWGHVAVVGALVQVIYFGLGWFALSQGVSAGVMAILMSLQPILVAILAPRLVGEQVSWLHWIGLLLALAGVVIVIIARSDIEPPTLLNMGISILALLGVTAGMLYEKRFGISYHPVVSNLIQYSVGLILVLPLAYGLETMQVEWTGELMGALAYLVIGNSILAISLLLAMIREGEVSRVSALMFLVPPLAALFGWLLLEESMPLWAWLGMVMAGLGVILASRKAVTS